MLFNRPSDTATVDELFDAFTKQFSRKDLFETAMAYMSQIQDISPLALEDCEGGLMGRIIFNLLSPAEDSTLTQRLMEHYEFTAETIPPRLLFRELLRLEVHRNKLLSRMDLGKDEMVLAFVEAGLLELTEGMSNPSEVTAIPDETLDLLIQNIEVMKGRK